ncbi:MAG: hypothetical protein KGH53_02965, partial [Candidatus Micrarchaeota archaeon]|nr:hypothetical protein [Candidatus Micrarchaeota archaeon]
CGCSTTSDEPNSSICEICMGFPGSKPMLNKAALELGVNIAKALHCEVPEKTSFVRKVYFYPDLPKSYQITQLKDSVGTGGYVKINNKKIRLRRIQLEEDPAKTIRAEGHTLIDFNRSGIPLVEIITEPDIENIEELRDFIRTLVGLLSYFRIDISKEIKIDLNISTIGDRVEIKNITGWNNFIKAAESEIERQENSSQKGKKILFETRSYNEKTLKTESSREKESDEEYGFIFEPDLTSYKTEKYSPPPIWSEVINNYEEKYGLPPKVFLEEFGPPSRDLFDLVENAIEVHEIKNKADMKKALVIIQLIKRYEWRPTKDEFILFLKNIKKMSGQGLPITIDTLEKIRKGVNVELKTVSSTIIDSEIRSILNDRTELLREFEKNPKSLNFLVGEVSKKLKANPREVAERLRLVLEKEYKS